eukprot:45348-Amphidinium_carterae.1
MNYDTPVSTQKPQERAYVACVCAGGREPDKKCLQARLGGQQFKMLCRTMTGLVSFLRAF